MEDSVQKSGASGSPNIITNRRKSPSRKPSSPDEEFKQDDNMDMEIDVGSGQDPGAEVNENTANVSLTHDVSSPKVNLARDPLDSHVKRSGTTEQQETDFIKEQAVKSPRQMDLRIDRSVSDVDDDTHFAAGGWRPSGTTEQRETGPIKERVDKSPLPKGFPRKQSVTDVDTCSPSKGRQSSGDSKRQDEIKFSVLGANTRRDGSVSGGDGVSWIEPVAKLLQDIYQSGLWIIVVSISLIVMAIVVQNLTSDGENINLDSLKVDPNRILNDFLESFSKLSNSFPAQTDTFWKVLRAGTRSIMRPEPPDQPAVFIVAVPQGAEQSAHCVIQKYADILKRSFNGSSTIEFSHHLRGSDTPEHIKEVIDSTLSEGFSLGSRVAIIRELDKLHGISAMMFHGYCDNENAPFTRVAFVLMLNMETIGEETDDGVERRLSQVWGSVLDKEILDPLLSRIGNRNAFARQESDEILQANGCDNETHD